MFSPAMIFRRDRMPFAMLDGRRRQRLQQAVDAQPHLQRIAKGLDVQVGGALLDR